ncbi:MAG: hypothetical protein ACTSPB_00685 [Candidatus Thorarchaeota archaeon]
MNTRYIRVYFVLGLFLLTSIFFSTISARASTSNLVENEFMAQFSPLEVDDGSAVNMYDEVNRSQVRTGFNTWEEDWGEDDVPKGIYVGTAFAPSVLDTGIQRTYRRCVFEVGFTVNFSAKEIMNGASSFWVKIPVVFNDDLFNFTDIYPPYNLDNVQSFIDGLMVSSPETVVVGSSIYVYFHYILQPSVEYDFLFRLPLHYWGESLIPVNGYYDPTVAPRVLLTDENIYAEDRSFYGFLTTDKGLSQSVTNSSYVDFDGVSIISVPDGISLGFSFIFTNGVGIGGLFGKAYPIVPYNSFSATAYNTSLFRIATRITHNGSSGGYVSVNIPFYSSSPIFLVQATVFILNSSHGSFVAFSQFCAYTVSNNYSGMFILSFPTPLTLGTPPSNGIPAVVHLYIRNSIGSVGKISFLHTSNLNNSAINEITGNPVFYEGVSFYNIYSFRLSSVSWFADIDEIYLYERIFYDFVCYAETTGGQWAWIWHNATGGVQYDYVFRQKIYVPITIYNITNGDTGETIYVGTNGALYENWLLVLEKEDSGGSDESWLTKLARGIKLGIEWLHNGFNKAWGYIIDGIQALGDALYRLGELVVTNFMKFWGILESIVVFIEDNILNILELLVTTASAFLFLLIMPVVSRSFKSFFAHVGGNV